MDERKVYEVLAWASSFLEKHHREAHVAQLLMQHHLNVSNSAYHLMMHEIMTGEQYDMFTQDIEAHASTGIPVQHLIGHAHFYGRTFFVNEHVLIPRFETEELVHHVIEEVKKKYKDQPITIVDVGTGTGAIAITLALELRHATVYATDISAKALKVAEENANNLHADVTFLQGDFLQPVVDRNIQPEIIVSNPPYIDEADDYLLTDTVKKFDPHLALFAKNHGLAAYETIMKQSSNISTCTQIYFEIGYDQAISVSEIVRQRYPHSHIEKIVDINGNDRIISISL